MDHWCIQLYSFWSATPAPPLLRSASITGWPFLDHHTRGASRTGVLRSRFRWCTRELWWSRLDVKASTYAYIASFQAPRLPSNERSSDLPEAPEWIADHVSLHHPEARHLTDWPTEDHARQEPCGCINLQVGPTFEAPIAKV